MCPLPCNIKTKHAFQNHQSNTPLYNTVKYRENHLANLKFILLDFISIYCVEYLTVGTFLFSVICTWTTITSFKCRVAFFLFRC